ncbi:MAG: ABC transporter permease, partial [Acidobacteriota bacterium]
RVALRGREFAIQSALGSSRFQVISQVLTESFLLALPGACLGLGLAHLAIAFFDRVIGAHGVPYWMHFKLSPAVFLATAGFTLVAALVAGLAPAIRASRSDMRQALSDGARGTSHSLGRLSRVMVVAQITVSTALCIGAGLAVRGVVAAQSYDHAFETENLLSARVGLPEGDYPDDAERLAFFETLLRRLEGEPGFESVAIGTVLPAENDIGSIRRAIQRPGEVYDRPAQMPSARFAASSPGYFSALGTEILTGRDFAPSDHAGAAPVAIVNESFAKREWPGEHPVGKEVDLWAGRAAEGLDAHAGKRRVVGVVPDLRFGGFGKAQDGSAVYVPLAQSPTSFVWIIARTRAGGEPAALSRPLRQAVLDLDPNLPLYNVH